MTNTICTDCILRIINNDHHNLQGYGNPEYGNVIIIPNVDYDSYKAGALSAGQQVKIIQSIISSTGEYSQFYIIPLLRCNVTISNYPIDNNIIDKCFINLIDEFRKYKFKNVLCLGKSAKKILGIEQISYYIDTCFNSAHHIRYCCSYNPLIKYVDFDKFKIFEENLKTWYNCCLNNDFSGYINRKII